MVKKVEKEEMKEGKMVNEKAVEKVLEISKKADTAKYGLGVGILHLFEHFNEVIESLTSMLESEQEVYNKDNVRIIIIPKKGKLSSKVFVKGRELPYRLPAKNISDLLDDETIKNIYEGALTLKKWIAEYASANEGNIIAEERKYKEWREKFRELAEL